MGQKLGCGDRDAGVDFAHTLKGVFTNAAAEDDAADELRSGSSGSIRSKKFGRHSSPKQSSRKLSIGSSFVGGGGVFKRSSTNRISLLEQKNKLLKKQLKKAKAKKAKTAEMA